MQYGTTHDNDDKDAIAVVHTAITQMIPTMTIMIMTSWRQRRKYPGQQLL